MDSLVVLDFRLYVPVVSWLRVWAGLASAVLRISDVPLENWLSFLRIRFLHWKIGCDNGAALIVVGVTEVGQWVK